MNNSEIVSLCKELHNLLHTEVTLCKLTSVFTPYSKFLNTESDHTLFYQKHWGLLGELQQKITHLKTLYKQKQNIPLCKQAINELSQSINDKKTELVKAGKKSHQLRTQINTRWVALSKHLSQLFNTEESTTLPPLTLDVNTIEMYTRQYKTSCSNKYLALQQTNRQELILSELQKINSLISQLQICGNPQETYSESSINTRIQQINVASQHALSLQARVTEDIKTLQGYINQQNSFLLDQLSTAISTTEAQIGVTKNLINESMANLFIENADEQEKNLNEQISPDHAKHRFTFISEKLWGLLPTIPVLFYNKQEPKTIDYQSQIDRYTSELNNIKQLNEDFNALISKYNAQEIIPIDDAVNLYKRVKNLVDFPQNNNMIDFLNSCLELLRAHNFTLDIQDQFNLPILIKLLELQENNQHTIVNNKKIKELLCRLNNNYQSLNQLETITGLSRADISLQKVDEGQWSYNEASVSNRNSLMTEFCKAESECSNLLTLCSQYTNFVQNESSLNLQMSELMQNQQAYRQLLDTLGSEEELEQEMEKYSSMIFEIFYQITDLPLSPEPLSVPLLNETSASQTPSQQLSEIHHQITEALVNNKLQQNDFADWYHQLYNTIRGLMIDSVSTHSKIYQLFEDIYFELEAYKTSISPVLLHYRKLCPVPEQGWRRLVSLKPAIPAFVKKNVAGLSSLTHFPAILSQGSHLRDYPLEKKLFDELLLAINYLADSNNYQIKKSITNWISDPRYEPLRRHRHGGRIIEALARFCTSIYNTLFNKHKNFREAFFYFPTDTEKWIQKQINSLLSP